MSSILKAIRKVEDEKRTSQGEAPDLMVDHGGPVERPRALLPLASGIVLGAVVVGLILLFVPRSADHVVRQPAPAEVMPRLEPPVVTVPAVPASADVTPDRTDVGSMKAVSTSSLPHPSPAIIEQMLPPETIAVAPVPGPKAPPVQPPVAAPPAASPSRTAPDMTVAHAAPHVPSADSGPTSLPAGVVLTVSEIFFQEDSSASMAVVNDLPVMVGTPVGNAVVEAIHADRVVFEIDGHSYPVRAASP